MMRKSDDKERICSVFKYLTEDHAQAPNKKLSKCPMRFIRRHSEEIQ